MGYLPVIIGVFTTAFAVASMQFKNMKFVLLCQLMANSLLVVQYIIEGRMSVSGVVILAIVQTVVSYIFGAKKKDFPVWLTGIFIVGYTVVSLLMMTSPYDIISCVAVWFFAICVVQKRSSICRICSFVNTLLWLIYDILCAPSAILTHGVIIVFIVVGIVRLDREDWKLFFSKVFAKRQKVEAEEEESKN